MRIDHAIAPPRVQTRLGAVIWKYADRRIVGGVGQALSTRDLKSLLAFSAGLHALLDVGRLKHFVVDGLPRLVAADFVIYTEIGPEPVRLTGLMSPQAGEFERLAARFAPHAHESPLLVAYEKGAGPAVQLTDFLSLRQFRDTGLYCDVFRPYGIDRQIAKGVPIDGRGIASVSLFRRGHDFGARDREMLNLMRPHLNLAFANARRFAAMQRHCIDAQADLPGLSSREREVMYWAACGRSNHEIGAILDISGLTVKKHLEHVYDKLGVANRTEAAALMAHPGIAGG